VRVEALPVVVVGGRVLFAAAQQPVADERREDHRDQPGDQQRDCDHRADREGVFAGGGFGEADRQNAAAVISVPVSIGSAVLV